MGEFFIKLFASVFEYEVNVHIVFLKLSKELSPPSPQPIPNDSIADFFRDGPSPTQRLFLVVSWADGKPLIDVLKLALIF